MKKVGFILIVIISLHYILRDFENFINSPKLLAAIALMMLIGCTCIYITILIEAIRTENRLRKKLGHRVYAWLSEEESSR